MTSQTSKTRVLGFQGPRVPGYLDVRLDPLNPRTLAPFRLGQIAFEIHRFFFADMCSLISHHGHSCISVKIVLLVLSAVVDQKVLFFVNEPQDIPLARLKMRGDLNRQSGTCLLTESAVNASCEVDPEHTRIAGSIFSLGRLHGDAADRADGRTEVASHATLISIRVARENDHSPGPGRKRPLILWILLGHRFTE